MPFKVYDVNSMYPYVMKNFMHPAGPQFSVDRQVSKKTFFIVAEGSRTSRWISAFAEKMVPFSFTHERGEFSCTIHEWRAAQDTGYFHPTRVKRVYNFAESICFDQFVDHFYKRAADC